jgi:hypothetical protein
MYRLPPDVTSLPPSVRKNNTPTITDASIVIISVIERFSNTVLFVLITLRREIAIIDVAIMGTKLR